MLVCSCMYVCTCMHATRTHVCVYSYAHMHALIHMHGQARKACHFTLCISAHVSICIHAWPQAQARMCALIGDCAGNALVFHPVYAHVYAHAFTQTMLSSPHRSIHMSVRMSSCRRCSRLPTGYGKWIRTRRDGWTSHTVTTRPAIKQSHVCITFCLPGT